MPAPDLHRHRLAAAVGDRREVRGAVALHQRAAGRRLRVRGGERGGPDGALDLVGERAQRLRELRRGRALARLRERGDELVGGPVARRSPPAVTFVPGANFSTSASSTLFAAVRLLGWRVRQQHGEAARDRRGSRAGRSPASSRRCRCTTARRAPTPVRRSLPRSVRSTTPSGPCCASAGGRRRGIGRRRRRRPARHREPDRAQRSPRLGQWRRCRPRRRATTSVRPVAPPRRARIVMPHAGLTVREDPAPARRRSRSPRCCAVHAAWSAGPKNGTFAAASAAVSRVGLAAGTTATDRHDCRRSRSSASDDVPT